MDGTTIIDNAQTTVVGMDFIGCELFELKVSIEECHNLDQLLVKGSSISDSNWRFY